MSFKKKITVLVAIALTIPTFAFADGKKMGWELELKQLALNLTSTEVHNSTPYKENGVSNARLTADSQTFIQGKLDFAANQFSSKLFWSNTLFMEYGKTYVRPVDEEEVITENSDKILIATDLTYRLWKIDNFLGGFEAGPFVNVGYETEFDAQENSELKKVVRGKAGAKLFEGKYLKQLYAAYVFEADYTPKPGPEVTRDAFEAGFRVETDIREGVKFVCWSYYRKYLSESRETITDLDYEAEAEARLDIKLWNNLAVAPFVNYYCASAKHFNSVGENWYTGVALSYSTFFKKAATVE